MQVHQLLNWFAHDKKQEHVKLFARPYQCHLKHSCPLLTCYTSTFHVHIQSMDTLILSSQLKQKAMLTLGYIALLEAHTLI